MQDTPRWLQTSPLDGGPVIRDGDRTIVFEPVSPDWNPKKPWWRKVLQSQEILINELHTHIYTLRPAGLYEETNAGPGRLSGE